MNRTVVSTILLLCLLSTGPSAVGTDSPAPRQSYGLQLEARPTAVFPFLNRLGTVDIAVYPQGVRADSLWLDGYLKAGSKTVRIENPSLRIYSDASLSSLRQLFRSLAPEKETATLGELPVTDTGRKGTIKDLPVRCYRITLGKKAWIDVWTTEALKESQPYTDLQNQVLAAVSPDLARAGARIPGTPLHVILNTRDHPETTLLATKQIFRSSAGHEEALQTGRFFLKAPSIDRLMK